MSLTNETVKNRYGDLLIVNNNGSGVSTGEKTIMGGTGTNSVLSISDDSATLKPQNDNTSSTLSVKNASGTSIMSVDTSDSEVIVNGNNVNTGCFMFTGFNVSLDANTWTPLMFGNQLDTTVTNTFGTSTNPATTFDFSGGAVEYAVHQYLVLPFDITIDSVNIYYNGDSASSDNIKFSLNSYTLSTSGGASGDLSSGAILYSTSASSYDNTKMYKETLSVTTNNADSGKVLMFMAHQNGTNNDLHARAYIKYHIK